VLHIYIYIYIYIYDISRLRVNVTLTDALFCNSYVLSFTQLPRVSALLSRHLQEADPKYFFKTCGNKISENKLTCCDINSTEAYRFRLKLLT